MKKKIAVIFCLIVLMTPLLSLAQTTNNPCSVNGIGNQNVSSALPKCVNQIYVWSLGVSVLLAMLMIVLGGYYIMTAGGNAEQSSKGKEYITSALIGVVILFAAYLLLNEINPDLVNFNLNSLNGLNPSTQNQTCSQPRGC
jgi:hypothetical protein